MNTTRIIVFLTDGWFAKGYSQSEVIRLWDGKARGSENSTSNETEVATPHGRIIQNVVYLLFRYMSQTVLFKQEQPLLFVLEEDFDHLHGIQKVLSLQIG